MILIEYWSAHDEPKLIAGPSYTDYPPRKGDTVLIALAKEQFGKYRVTEVTTVYWPEDLSEERISITLSPIHEFE